MIQTKVLYHYITGKKIVVGTHLLKQYKAKGYYEKIISKIEPLSKEELITALENAGKKVDRRLGVDRLNELVLSLGIPT